MDFVILVAVGIILWNICYCIQQFLQYLLSVLVPYSPFIASLAAVFPTSLYMLRKCFGLNGDHFVKYVVCPHCNSLYELEKCFESCDVLRTTHKLCTFTPFPKHPQPLKRKPCGHQLFKEIVLKSGKKSYYPLKVYCYKSLTESLATLLQRDGIIDLCEHWRQRQVPDGYLCDIRSGVERLYEL